MYIDEKIVVEDDLGLKLISKSAGEKTYRATLKDSDHKWVEVFINNKARLYYYVSIIEITYTEHEIIFDFIQHDNKQNYPSIYTLNVPEKVSLWREQIGEKAKVMIKVWEA